MIIQFIIPNKECDTRSETSKTTAKTNQQEMQRTTTKGKTTKKSSITTSDKSSSLPETSIEPLYSSE